MSFARFPKWVLKPETFAGMKPVTVKVLACLADCLNSSDDRGKISVRVLGERCGLARRTVQMALADLAELGVIDRDQATGEYSFLPKTGGAPQCAGAHEDALGGAPACARGRTTMREGAHERAQVVGRNKDSPKTSYQEPSTKKPDEERRLPRDGFIPEGGGDPVFGIDQTAAIDGFIRSVGWTRVTGTDQDALRDSCWDIRLGSFPEIPDSAKTDPLGYLRPRLAAYWREQESYRRENPSLKAPSFRLTMQEGRWRFDPDESEPEMNPKRAADMERIKRAREARKAASQ